MKRKVVFLVAITAILSASSTFAQMHEKDWKSCSDKQQKGTCAQLNLSSDQQTQIVEINKRYALKRNILNNERNAELQKVLTKEQYEKFQQIQLQREEKRSAAHHGRYSSDQRKGINHSMVELNLTPDQLKQLNTINLKYNQLRKEIKSKILTSESRRDTLIKVRDSQMKEINGMLTSQQQAQLKELKQQAQKNRCVSKRSATNV